MTNAIEAHDLRKTFGGEVRALDGVSFAVEEGTIFGLLGPNGAGKTTAVRILTTILAPDGGTGLRPRLRRGRRRPIVSGPSSVWPGQYAAVDENLTGRENLTMVGRLNHLAHDVVAKRAIELLEQFGLTDAGDRPLKTYSGGMRAPPRRRRRPGGPAEGALPRRAHHRARPPEPGRRVGDDRPARGRGHQRAAHHPVPRGGRHAWPASIAVVDHGRVIAEGTPTQLKADLGATVLDVGLADAELARQAAGILDAVGAKSPTVVGTIVELPVDDGPRVAMEVLRLLDQHALVPTTFRIREPSLDDVFLALTGKRTEADDDDTTMPPTDGKRRRRRAPAAAGDDQ